MSDWSRRKKKVAVHGHQMAYVEDGKEGPTVLFLHGNPTSSFLWRDVMPPVAAMARCYAPDLIGMGDSDKLAASGPDSYRFTDHRNYLDGFLDAVVPEGPVFLVLHDWGSALGFDWANRHRDRVAGIAYMEGIVRPLAWSEWNEQARPVFEGFRSPAGEAMVLEKNVFVERVLPGSIMRDLTEAEMAEYRRPFAEPGEGRRPTLTWPRQIPLNGEPADVAAIVADYADWLSRCDVPKLFINADPGAILIGAQRKFCRAWPNQREVTVRGTHFIQEDSPREIGDAIAGWLEELTG